MNALKRDTATAIGLLLICGAFLADTFTFRDPGFSAVGPALWPRIILAPLTLLCLIYLVRSLRATGEQAKPEGGWLGRYRNALWCYALFSLFLMTLPYLGLLIGGSLFVFALLTAIGGHAPRQLALHLVVAIAAVGFMWAVFTYGLKVMLPEGEILSIY